jgi:hypothetical protein
VILTIWMDGCQIEGTYEEIRRLFDLILQQAVLEAGIIPCPS